MPKKKATKKRATKTKKRPTKKRGTKRKTQSTKALQPGWNPGDDEPKPKPLPEPKTPPSISAGGNDNWKTETQRPTFEDTSATEARLLLGLMRDRAVFVANASDEAVKQLRKGFNDRTIAAYDRVLQLLDPTMKRFEFRTEIRFASKPEAGYAQEEEARTPKADFKTEWEHE